MFNASKGYGSAFDGDIWKPEGMPDAVGSDQGLDGFVTNPLKAREMETRMAGDALMNFAGVKDAKYMADAQVEAAEIRKEQMEKAQQKAERWLGRYRQNCWRHSWLCRRGTGWRRDRLRSRRRCWRTLWLMAISPHKLRNYADIVSRATGMSIEAAEQALIRKGSMPNVPDDLFSEISNLDLQGRSGMPAQETYKNIYLDHLDVTGSGQPRSSLKPGNIQEIAPQAKPLTVQPVAQTSAAPKATATPTPTKVSYNASPSRQYGSDATAQSQSRCHLRAVPRLAPVGVAGQAVEANPGLFGGIFDDVLGEGNLSRQRRT